MTEYNFKSGDYALVWKNNSITPIVARIQVIDDNGDHFAVEDGSIVEMGDITPIKLNKKLIESFDFDDSILWRKDLLCGFDFDFLWHDGKYHGSFVCTYVHQLQHYMRHFGFTEVEKNLTIRNLT